MPTSIKIENLSKQYRLGVVGTGTLSHDLNRWWTMNIRRKDDPYLKIGETNDRATKGSSDYIWALRDINLEIEQGDVVGIIGKNGAGKSTLLKILSRVTKPTTGGIKYNGRIASLLEVGTGFHPEMTGRENIYMNGAIMGMNRAEIARKFDEIVAFAGVERYIDTPVKRYSSGMTVRLGFSIAAHLEPDILVVDEVLAVGDAEFQKKAIGKMQDVSKEGGRTVLFVSHNMGAIKNLCNQAILLEEGNIQRIGTVNSIIDNYMSNIVDSNYSHIKGNQSVNINSVRINELKNDVSVNIFDRIIISIGFILNDRNFEKAEFFILFYNQFDEVQQSIFQRDENRFFQQNDLLKNEISAEFTITLPPGSYRVSVGVFNEHKDFLDWVINTIVLNVEYSFSNGGGFDGRLGNSYNRAVWKNY